ncbi:MAG: crossover junction endodeoxyribonuclease RuvC [Endomicrobium sp.]|jgi:crossover junction endodeoxyribonuclease RuvC|nr:crossover junction endodeoxyribonuclease RuvC [Endomicrobium sp.]
MIILGIDPGIALTGWGVLNAYSRDKFTFIDCGCIETHSNSSVGVRLAEIHNKLQFVITQYKPHIIAIEELFFMKLTKNILAIAQARGVMILTISLQQIPLFEYNPKLIKLTLTGNGNASKKQIQDMVKDLLNLKTILKPDDIADALAIAICHINNIEW